MDLNQEVLATVAGIVLSLLFSYIPGLKSWYENLSGDYKSLIMLAALLVVTLGILGLSCIDWIDAVACDVTGIKELIWIFVLAAIANQGTYTVTRKLK